MLTNPSRRYRLDTRVVDADLSVERPIWPLSAYGPGVNAPRQLIEGDVEISPEEMRLQAYLLKSQGNEGQIVSGFAKSLVTD
jgi:nucleoporin NUP42